MDNYLFKADDSGARLHLSRNPKLDYEPGSLGAKIYAVLNVIAAAFLLVLRNFWVAVVLFAFVSQRANLSDLLGLLAVAYGFRRLIDFFTQPKLVHKYGIPLEYIFSRDAVTIQVTPVGAKSPQPPLSYCLPYCDLAVSYVDTMNPGGHIAFQVTSRNENDSFNKWLGHVAAIRAVSFGDVAMVGKVIDPWLTCSNKWFSTKDLQKAIQGDIE